MAGAFRGHRSPIFNLTAASSGITAATPGSIAQIDCHEGTVLSAAISGTFAGITLAAEVSLDKVNWFPSTFVNPTTGASSATITPTSATPIVYTIPKSGFRYARVRCTNYTSGTAIVFLLTSAASSSAGGSSAGSLAGSVTDGTKATSTTAAQLVGTPTPAIQGVWVSNMDASITVFVGASTVVTAGTRGVALAAGQRDFFPVADASLLYVVAASGTPTVGYLVT